VEGGTDSLVENYDKFNERGRAVSTDVAVDLVVK
jgi:hypothetical protein